jgi:hypothetical protein
MTLGNMWANGVRALEVSCWLCHHRAILSAEPLRDHRRRRAADLARAGPRVKAGGFEAARR